MKTFVPFTGFPTVDRLAKAQAEYAAAKLPVKRGDNGVPEPFPPPTKKADVFRPEDFKDIDAHARQVIIENIMGNTIHAVSEELCFYGDSDIAIVILLNAK